MKAYLLPNQHTILVKTGANYGISTLVKRRKFKGKFLIPIRYEYTEFWIYPDYTVRNTNGKFLGYYIGFEQDRLVDNPLIFSNSDFGGMTHDILIRFAINGKVTVTSKEMGREIEINVKEGEIHSICSCYVRDIPEKDRVITQRMGWEQYREIQNWNPDFTEFSTNLSVSEKIILFSKLMPYSFLKALLEYQKI